MKERFKLVPAVALVLKKDDKLLLQKRCNTGYCDDCYGLVGGGIDGNETVLQAMIREAKEEIGITLQKNDLNVVHVLHKADSDGYESIVFFIEASQWHGEPHIMEPDKCTDLCWVTLSNLPHQLVDHLKQTLGNISKNKFYSEWGF